MLWCRLRFTTIKTKKRVRHDPTSQVFVFFIRYVKFLNRTVPVLVWIYGGGYIRGSKTITGSPDGLVARAKGGMIYVAMNYRLGVYVSVESS
jgi:carboxylesterase type B